VQTRREQAAPQQFEQARLRSVCTVLAAKSMVMADIKAEYLACPIRHVVSRFGDKWSMLVLYMLYKSETGVLRFNEIRKLMSDCSQKMLSQTLKNLEQSHLVHREVYPEVPPRVEYSLTDTGRSLMPVLTDLIAWGQQHFKDVVTD
jgi:DNA-binding HxlR family transcriptional regulator